MLSEAQQTGDTPHERDDWEHALFDLAEVILVGLGLDGRVIRINRKGAELLGYPKQEIIGRNWFEAFVPPKAREEVRRVFQQLKEQPETAAERFENPVLCRDKSERIIAWRNTAVRDGNGRIVAGLSSGEDITERRRAETALRRSEARFRATFEQAAVGMAHVGLDGRFLCVNDKLCEITGYSRGELEARTFQDITHPDDLAVDLAQAQALRAGDIPHYTMEKRYIRKDGSTIWASLTGSVVCDEAGRPAYFVAVVEDIQLRKQAEALRSSEELQRMALSAARAGAWEWDAATGAQSWSPEIYDIYGLDPNEGPLDYELWLARCVAPEDHLLVNDVLRRANTAEGGEFRVAFRSRHPRKGVQWVVVNGRLICDPPGRPLRAFGLSRDITQTRCAELALHDSEERLRLAMEAGQIGVWEWHIESGKVTWSENLCRLMRMERDSPVETFAAFHSLVHPEDRGLVGEKLSAALAGKSEYNVAFRMICPDGRARWSETRAVVVRDRSGKPVRMVGIDMDITAAKEAEEQQQRLMEELDHRVKNVIAVTQAIATLSLEGGPERTAFLGRLSSLARAHSLLTAAGWEAADLATLVRQELSAYPPHRAVFSGPALGLSPRTAQTLALVLHELGTNAVKYGALSEHSGKIEVAWCLTHCPEPMLELMWRESGGPCVSPPARVGRGTRLIERSVLAEGGEVEMDYRSEGLFARLRLPDWSHNRT